jgi:zinc transport system substrate-binding protein
MNNTKKIVFAVVVVAIIAMVFILNQEKAPIDKRKMVAVSTFSLYDITKHIAGDSVKIVNIIPFGVDAHSFEPTPKLMAEIERSALVIYSGAGLEPWTRGYEFKNKVIDMSKHVRIRELDADEHEHHTHHDEQCIHNKIDPHYWLDFANMEKATEIVTQNLIKLEPKNELMYTENKKKYIKMLNSLNQDFSNSLKSCNLDTIIVNHNAFGYLSHRFGFHVESLSGLVPQAQPSAKDMSRVIKVIQEHDVPVVFAESFVSAKAMQSVAGEAKVKVEVLQPLGNITADEAKKNLTYEDIMRENLQKIHKALMCR